MAPSESHAGMPSRSLRDVAAELAARGATPQELHDAFLSAQVFCEAGEGPGFVALGAPGDGFIPVFTSMAELARARGPVRWFATTGADLISLIPAGYDIVLDMAAPAPLRLRPAALQATTVAEVDWR